MTKTIACAISTLSLLAVTDPASAKGCIKGAIVGGVAGHLAGHGALGAAAGCAIGHHEANKPSTTGSAAAVGSQVSQGGRKLPYYGPGNLSIALTRYPVQAPHPALSGC
jgi:hypothetical protein